MQNIVLHENRGGEISTAGMTDSFFSDHDLDPDPTGYNWIIYHCLW